MILNQFVNKGSDEETVNNLQKSFVSKADLQKAMNKAGLVQKEVQVTGKNGQTFTRKQWVKASEEQKSGDKGEHAKDVSSEKKIPSADTMQNMTEQYDAAYESVESEEKIDDIVGDSGTAMGLDVSSKEDYDFLVSKGVPENTVKDYKEAVSKKKKIQQDIITASKAVISYYGNNPPKEYDELLSDSLKDFA